MRPGDINPDVELELLAAGVINDVVFRTNKPRPPHLQK